MTRQILLILDLALSVAMSYINHQGTQQARAHEDRGLQRLQVIVPEFPPMPRHVAPVPDPLLLRCAGLARQGEFHER